MVRAKGRHGIRGTAAGTSRVRGVADQGDPFLRSAAHGASGADGMGADQIQVRKHRRGRARETPVRLVLYQERLDRAGPADHVPNHQDRSAAPGRAMKWMFWIAAVTIGYAYVGYSAWLWVRSHWAPRPVRRGAVEPAVSAVMVVRNEDAVLAQKLENLLTLEYSPEKMEIVVVSDGSTDGTGAILEEFAAKAGVRTLLKAESRGKALG